MNAPATVAQLRADPISILKPDCTDPAERHLRERLMIARDVASADLHRISGHAQSLALMIVEVSGAWIFAPASIEDLQEALACCRALMRCVVLVERLETAA